MWGEWVSVCARPQRRGFQNDFSVSHRQVDRWYGNIHKKGTRARGTIGLSLPACENISPFLLCTSTHKPPLTWLMCCHAGVDLMTVCSASLWWRDNVMQENRLFTFTFRNDYCNYSIFPCFWSSHHNIALHLFTAILPLQKNLITHFHKHTNTLTHILWRLCSQAEQGR